MTDKEKCKDPQGKYPAGFDAEIIDIGLRHFIWHQQDGRWLWWHDCVTARPAWGWFGDVHTIHEVGPISSGHKVIDSADGITVQGSLICEDCGDHGFIENGKWRKA